MDCGIANLETGYPKPDSVGSGGPSGILKTDSRQVLAGLPSAIRLSRAGLLCHLYCVCWCLSRVGLLCHLYCVCWCNCRAGLLCHFPCPLHSVCFLSEVVSKFKTLKSRPVIISLGLNLEKVSGQLLLFCSWTWLPIAVALKGSLDLHTAVEKGCHCIFLFFCDYVFTAVDCKFNFCLLKASGT